GDTLSSLAHRIYGRSDPEVLRLIKLNNPGLTNINNLRIGQTIRFPHINGEPF
ncbi:MAG: LysM peptidoglycan-binding domain-containing protein, partial [Deltaproteobacteria bacterium]|nr:LysM peptidoglycan-binding domain-containing protein [Deltaproteobacteria bacterium]